VVIPNLTLPGNPGSNLILVTEIEIQFIFPDESRKLPRIQLRGNIFLRRLSMASFAIDHPSWGQTFLPPLIAGRIHKISILIIRHARRHSCVDVSHHSELDAELGEAAVSSESGSWLPLWVPAW
jgi:hypothetical protein